MAACCYYESRIASRCGISVLGNSARIDVSDKESKYPAVSVKEENALIVPKAAYLATKDMFYCQNPEDCNSVVNSVVNDKSRAIIYYIQGRRKVGFHRGVKIVCMKDSSFKKVVYK